MFLTYLQGPITFFPQMQTIVFMFMWFFKEIKM